MEHILNYENKQNKQNKQNNVFRNIFLYTKIYTKTLLILLFLLFPLFSLLNYNIIYRKGGKFQWE